MPAFGSEKYSIVFMAHIFVYALVRDKDLL